MDEKFTDLAVHLQEVDSRSRSNEHRIDAHEKEIHELREKQDAIYEIASSVKSIATDMTYMKEDVKEVKSGQDKLKAGQDKLNQKVTEIENKPANEAKRRMDKIGDKLLWLLIGGVAAGLLYTILPNIPW